MATTIKLYTKAEREAALTAWSAGEIGSKHGASKLTRADNRTLPARKARVREFQRTGKVPAGWMTPNTLKIPRKMPDEEAARVVLPAGLRPRITMPPDPTDKLTEQVGRKYLAAMGRKVKGVEESKPWPAAQFTTTVEVWTCGCRIEGDGKFERNHYTGEFVTHHREQVTPCKRHKRAFQGREED
jgi:hypothetical protein